MSPGGSGATDQPRWYLDSVTTAGAGTLRVVIPETRRSAGEPSVGLHCEVMGITSALAVPAEEIDRRRTFWVACAGLAIVTAALMIAIVVLTRGTLTYIIDDAYIHLSMARTFATTGTWGVVPGDWESADSSPGWILLLAALIKVVPAVAEWLPFVINGLAALVVLWLVTARQELVVLRRGRNSPVRYLAVMLLPSVLFLPELIVLGMEHTVQTALILGLLIAFEWLIRDGVTARRVLVYALFSLLGSAIRFETLFLSAGCALALMVPPLWSSVRLRRPDPRLWLRIVAAAAGTAAAAIPIVVMGVVDLAHGAFFFPNSIVEKTALLGPQSLLQAVVPSLSTIWGNLSLDPFLIVLLGFGVVIAVRGPALRPLWAAWVIGTLLHASYGQFGWNDRYQAYLVIVGVWLTLRTLPRIEWAPVQRRLVLALVLLLVVLPIGKFDYIVNAPSEALVQTQVQQQMADFLTRYYDGRTVMVNDIGRVTWEHRGGLLDAWALASVSVLRLQYDGEYNSAHTTVLASQDHVAAVAVYSPTFNFLVPEGYVKAAVWQIAQGANSAATAVIFYAPAGAQAQAMAGDMRAFAPGMIPGSGAVTVFG